jgi:glutathione gamma-glutamylcysteinyltransferase
MTMDGFYRRPLPPPLVAFASDEGRALFREALAEGDLEGYFALAEQFHTQSEPAYCGLGSLVVALNALGIDPGRLWKGPWRWYSEELLDCCVPLDRVEHEGITLDQLLCLARCNGARGEVTRADEGGFDRFREAVRTAVRTPSGVALVAAYARAELGQIGSGHYSPVAGYHAGRDLVLVLDVARFKYPAHWVPAALLWEAMRPIDPSTRRSRGYVTLRRGGALSVFFLASTRRHAWRDVLAALDGRLRDGLREDAPGTLDALGRSFVRHLGPELAGALETREAPLSPEHAALAEALFAALRALPVHASLSAALAPRESVLAGRPHGAEIAAVLLLACADVLAEGTAAPTRALLQAVAAPGAVPEPVASEIAVVREQVAALTRSACAP